MSGFVVLLLLLATLVQSSTAYSTGHPDTGNYCNEKVPAHGSSVSIQGGSAYQVTAKKIDSSTTEVCVKTTPNGPQPYFEGFFLKALRCDSKALDFTDYIGSFSIDADTTVAKIICPSNSAVTHTSHTHLTQTCVTWTPLRGASPECVNFCATVVRNYEIYYYDVCTLIMLQEPTTVPPLTTSPSPPVSATPSTDCSGRKCKPHETCKTFQATGEKYCDPTCHNNGPCGDNETCYLAEVQCVRDPCPPGVVCVCGKCPTSTQCQSHHKCQVHPVTRKHYCTDTCINNGPCGRKEVCHLRNATATCLPLVSCKPRRVSQHITHGNCTSAEPIDVKLCDGVCLSGRSCQATKTREKSFPFRCGQKGKIHILENLSVPFETECECQ